MRISSLATAISFMLGALMLADLAQSAVPNPPGRPRALQKRIRKLVRSNADKHGNGDDIRKLVAAAKPGDTVNVPAGCYRIEKKISVPHGVRLLGAGMERTVLYRDPKKCANSRGVIIFVKGRKGTGTRGLTQVAGMAFVGITAAKDKGWDGAVSVRDVLSFRVDHCYFDRFGSSGVGVSGKSRGVIDHCVFVDNFKKAINNVGYGVVVMGENTWPKKCVPGSAEAVFIEDCVLVGSRHAVASNAGAHYVFRHNLVWGNVNSQAVDAHGMGYGSKCGTRMVEVYDNIINRPVAKVHAILIRGGDGVVFNNRVRGYRHALTLCLEFGTPPELKKKYPARDQVRDLWAWNNTLNGKIVPANILSNAKGFIKLGRDYYNKPRPDYKPYVYPHPQAKGGKFD